MQQPPRHWRNQGVSLNTKLRLLDCLVLPIALYGCETWTMNKADIDKLVRLWNQLVRLWNEVSTCDVQHQLA